MNALWGKLASEILMFRWDDALADMNLLLEAIENKVILPHHSHHYHCAREVMEYSFLVIFISIGTITATYLVIALGSVCLCMA